MCSCTYMTIISSFGTYTYSSYKLMNDLYAQLSQGCTCTVIALFAPRLIIERTYVRTWDEAVVTAVIIETLITAVIVSAFSAVLIIHITTLLATLTLCPANWPSHYKRNYSVAGHHSKTDDLEGFQFYSSQITIVLWPVRVSARSICLE